MPIIPTAFGADTFRAGVAMKVLLRVAHGYTHTVHLCRDTGQRVDMRRVRDVCARGAAGIAIGCQGIVTLPDLRMNLVLLQSLHAYVRI